MDINRILKSDYLDILFEGRNKTYGGYELRKKYPSRARNAAIALFEEYGPRIWSRAKNRPWLFNPGEIKKHAPYKRKLYYDVPEDNAL